MSSDIGLRAHESRRQRRKRLHVCESSGLQGNELPREHAAAFGQHGGVLLDHQPGQQLHRQCSGRFRRERFLAVSAGTPAGKFKDAEVSKTIWPRRTPLRAFRGNVAHSNFDGFMFDRNIYEDNTFGLATIPFLPLANPADLDSEVVESHFESLTSYKNRNGGL